MKTAGRCLAKGGFFCIMRTMKVILLRDIARLGQRGEVKEVAEGYAMNVLIKKGDAVHATPGELAKWKSRQDAKQHQKELATNTFTQLIDTLRKQEIVITGKKADQKGQLFASIKETDIAEAIYTTAEMSVDPKQILIAAPIKSLGAHTVTLKQGEKKEMITIQVR
jgi:large subunit ribosomal protein L9